MPSFHALYSEIDSWDGIDSFLPSGEAENILDDLHFHALLRYKDFTQFEELEGPYGIRLLNFLRNVTEISERAALLKIAAQLQFIDLAQRESLYRDSFRKQILPWLEDAMLGSTTCVLPDPGNISLWLQEVQFVSVTESFDHPKFFQVNNIEGTRKPKILGEMPGKIDLPPKASIFVVQEDFVGTGSQCVKALKRLRKALPEKFHGIFCPTVILEGAIAYVKGEVGTLGFQFSPTFIVPETLAITPTPRSSEEEWHQYARDISINNASRILETAEGQTLAFSEFGYGDCGALFAATHNVPNNSLPLIFRRTLTWAPLFRRREAIYDYRDETLRS